MQFIISFLSKFPVWLLLILSGASVITGDFMAKYWSLHQRHYFFLIACVAYFFSGFFYTPVLLRENLIITALIWVLLSTIGFIFIGLFVFDEILSLTQVIGVILGTIALILLTL